MSNLLKGNRAGLIKTAAVLTAVSTVLSLSAVLSLTAFAVVPSDYGLKEGNTISTPGSNDPDVYIVNDWGYKRLFLNPQIFNLYGHLGGFAAVKNVSATTRDAFVTSGLFRVDGTEKVYGIESISEDVAVLHWVNTSGAQAVADDANFFKKVFIINQAEFNLYSVGSQYTSVNQVPNYARVPGATPLPSGPITASLASSNPASGTAVQAQSRYDLAEFMFSGTGTVTSVKLKRIGVSADATLSNVYLYDGTKRLTDSATVSDGVISFNDSAGLFTVAGSKVISVMADILDTTSGQTIGVQLTSVNSVAYSISGNLHTIADADLATVALSTSITPALNDALDPANDVVGWSDTVTVGVRYVWLKSVQFRVIGSVLPADLQNFRLFIDGVQKGSVVAQADANGYLVFDFSGAPLKVETGGRVFKVLLDVIGGSDRTFKISLRQASDIFAVDSQYSAGVLSTGTFPADAGVQTVAAGSLTITKKTDSPSGDVVKDATGVVLGKFEFKAQGEKMKIESLNAAVNYLLDDDSALTLRNGALFVNDGNGGTAMTQIGSTAALCSSDDATCLGNAVASGSYTQYSLGSSLIVEPGHPRIVEIRADIYDSDGTNDVSAADTIQAFFQFVSGSSNVQRLTSLNYVDGPLTVDQTANTLTVKTGSMTVGKYTGYANQTIVAPKNGVKFGHFTMTAASSEDVNVNTIDITGQMVVDSGDNWDEADISDMYIKVFNDSGLLIYTSPTKGTVDETASNSYSVNFSLPKSKTYQVEVWGNITGTDAASLDSFTLSFDASGVTANSSTTSDVARVTGQIVQYKAGVLTHANGSLPVDRFVGGGTTGTGYQFTLTPAYDDFTLDEVYVDLSSTVASSTGAVATLNLKNSSGTVISSATVIGTTGSASFTGLNLLLAQSAGTKTYTVDVVFSNVGVGANDTAGDVVVRLDGLKSLDSAGTITTENGYDPTTYGGNDNYVVKGYPTFTNMALGTSVLSTGTQTLFKTSLSATGNQIAWNALTFRVASTSTTTAITSYKLFENGSDTGDTASISHIAGQYDRVEFNYSTERVVSVGSPVTLELRGTVGAVTSGKSVSTQIANPSTTTVTSDDSTVQADSGASFVWTDNSATSHTTATDDWFTDGLLKTLIDTQSLTN